MLDDLHWQSLSDLAQALRTGDTSPTDLVGHYLQRIASLDPTLHAFRVGDPEAALARAEVATVALQRGHDPGPLFGLPYAVKDLFDVAGMATGAGSVLLEQQLANRHAAVVRRLNDAGMILLGKTHTVQLAYGGAGINHDRGTPHNPWDSVHRLPGGSSSGSAVAVAAGLAPMALGTDTGGSVRIPASLCGITGLKTTVGRVSRGGVYPLSWSLDSVGPLTRSAKDAALVYEALCGPDADDPATWGRASDQVLGGLDAGVAGLRLAFAESVFWEDAQEDVAAAVRATGEVFDQLGAGVSSVPFEEARQAVELNPRGLVIAAEAYSLNRELLEEHGNELDPIVVSRVRLGKDVPSRDYLATVAAWRQLRVSARRALENVDALLCPTTPITAVPLAQADADLDTYVATNLRYLRNTAIGNILDLCAVSVPCGFDRDGLPIGLMIYGEPFDEATVLRVAHAFQQATDWHLRAPDLGWV